jgi:hypothetical protein
VQSSSVTVITIKFSRKGCEDLINQLLGLGVEKHDDGSTAWRGSSLALLKKALSSSEYDMSNGSTYHSHTYFFLSSCHLQ